MKLFILQLCCQGAHHPQPKEVTEARGGIAAGAFTPGGALPGPSLFFEGLRGMFSAPVALWFLSCFTQRALRQCRVYNFGSLLGRYIAVVIVLRQDRTHCLQYRPADEICRFSHPL